MNSFLGVYRRRRISREAACWFARLENPDCADTQRAAFARWRVRNPEHACAYREVELLWLDGAEATQRVDVLEAARATLQGCTNARVMKRSWVPAVAALAVALVMSVTAWLVWGAPHAASVPGTRYTTVTGQQREVWLKDGSTVLLDTSTVIVVHYRAHRRTVELLRGRAQFDVRENRADPFEVTADGATVTDLGTVFQVGVNRAGVNVVLLDGKVSVATRTSGHRHSASLRPGEQLHYRGGVIGPVQQADALAARAWTRGEIVANDWSLQHLLTAMNRYSQTKLTIGDSRLRDIRLSGVLRAGDQKALLQALQQGWSVRGRTTGPNKVTLLRD